MLYSYTEAMQGHDYYLPAVKSSGSDSGKSALLLALLLCELCGLEIKESRVYGALDYCTSSVTA